MELNSTAPLPDELLASYLSRLAKINGFRDQRDIWNAVNGRSDCTSFIDAEVCFPRLAEVMGGIAGAAECLVKDCTFLPTQVILGELSDDQLLNIAAAVTMPSLSDLTFVGPAALKYCEQCIQDDSANHDVSYWHRVHQIPMVNVCPIHQVLLVRVQFKRADLHYKFPLPIEVPSRLISSPAGAMCAPMLAVAEIAQRALAASDEEWKQDLRAVICEELGNRRYLRRGAGLLRKILVADLSALLSKYFSPTTVEFVALRRIAACFGISRSPKTSLGDLFLIYFLFGSWDGFLERARWMSTFGSRYAGFFGKREAPPCELDPGRTYRNECMEFVARYPKGTRLEFTRKHYRAFRWLSRYDSALLDRLLPIPVGRAKQFDLFD